MSERTYTIRKPCGCLVAVALVDPSHKDQSIAKEVAKWIAEGENVQQETVERVRTSRFSCEICKDPQGRLFP